MSWYTDSVIVLCPRLTVVVSRAVGYDQELRVLHIYRGIGNYVRWMF